MTARPFRPVAGPNATSMVLAELARLHDQAEHQLWGKGRRLTQAQLARQSNVPLTTVNSWATGTALPRDIRPLAAVGAVLARWAGEDPPPVWEWERLLEADQSARAALGGGSGDDPGSGRLIAELTDPFALEVHRPVIVNSAAAKLPLLPPYVRRPHDAELARVVAQAAEGRSAMAVLVAGSSTGKTRACWEAIHELPAGWRLWHPFDPTRPEALLAELPLVGPRTVVWLNETQLYLDTPGDIGERVAATLSTLLGNASREPVLILGTLWPDDWATLTRAGAAHAQARRVLDGTDITVPASFTGPALADLQRVADSDARLAAAARAPQGEVTQYLAGVPELLARYRNAPPAARALIHAAMDARRLGHRPALPHALLATAAPAYLTDTEWDAVAEHWGGDSIEQALAYTAAHCKGVTGPLTRIRPRPAIARPRRPGLPPSGQEELDVVGAPVYRLADYLDQYGRRQRGDQLPPAGFWTAAADHAPPGDQAALGDAARARGLYRDAARLYKQATTRGDPVAAISLVNIIRGLGPIDHRPVHWAAAHATLDNPGAVALVLEALQEAGADQQVAALLARDPAAHVTLDHPVGVAFLLDELREAGADQQVAALLARDPAAHVTLDHLMGVALLLVRLREAGADGQVTALADRAAVHVPVDHLPALARMPVMTRLPDWLRQARKNELIIAMLGGDPAARLLDVLREAGVDGQVTALADQAAADVPLGHTASVARVFEELLEAGADQQVTALLARDPAAHVTLDDPMRVARLLEVLLKAGADQQVAALLARDPAAHVTLDHPPGVARLLEVLLKAGADEQVAALLARDPAAHVTLSRTDEVAPLLNALQKAGAHQQVTALSTRLADAGMFDSFHEIARPKCSFGREPDGSPAEPWDWDDLG